MTRSEALALIERLEWIDAERREAIGDADRQQAGMREVALMRAANAHAMLGHGHLTTARALLELLPPDPLEAVLPPAPDKDAGLTWDDQITCPWPDCKATVHEVDVAERWNQLYVQTWRPTVESVPGTALFRPGLPHPVAIVTSIGGNGDYEHARYECEAGHPVTLPAGIPVEVDW